VICTIKHGWRMYDFLKHTTQKLALFYYMPLKNHSCFSSTFIPFFFKKRPTTINVYRCHESWALCSLVNVNWPQDSWSQSLQLLNYRQAQRRRRRHWCSSHSEHSRPVDTPQHTWSQKKFIFKTWFFLQISSETCGKSRSWHHCMEIHVY